MTTFWVVVIVAMLLCLLAIERERIRIERRTRRKLEAFDALKRHYKDRDKRGEVDTCAG